MKKGIERRKPSESVPKKSAEAQKNADPVYPKTQPELVESAGLLQKSGHEPANFLKAKLIPARQRQEFARSISRLGGNQSLNRLLMQNAGKPGVHLQRQSGPRPALPEVNQLEDTPEGDPQANLSPGAIRTWESLDQQMRELRLNLYTAQNLYNCWSQTRDSWYKTVTSLSEKLDRVTRDDAIPPIQNQFYEFRLQMIDASSLAYDEWEGLKDKTAGELAGLMGGSGLNGIYAYEALISEYSRTRWRMERIDAAVMLPTDFNDFKEYLAQDTHIWKGEMRAAYKRNQELLDLLDLVGEIRVSGEDEDKVFPGWNKRIAKEIEHLELLAAASPFSNDQIRYMTMVENLGNARKQALDRKKEEKGFLDKLNDLAKGGVSAVTGPLIEAGKQAVDIAKILTFTGYKVMGGEGWEPELYSDMAKAAEQGADTGDLLIGMVEGIIDTPERVWEAIKNDDWETIGREAVNLYMLGKAAKQGVKGAKQLPEKIRQAGARANAVMRVLKAKWVARGAQGGMSEAAINVVRKLVMKHNLNILFRPVGKEIVRLREMGHPGKIMDLKMKTINQLDTYLGASKADIGKVGFFKPVLPENVWGIGKKGAVDVELSLAVKNRYKARMKEWETMQGKVQRLADRGIIEQQGQVIVDPVSGKAFTGDYDLFEIRMGKGGENVDLASLEKQVREALETDPVKVEHGAHLNWEDIKLGESDIFANIVRGHRPGKESLIEFSPDGKVRRTHFDD